MPVLAPLLLVAGGAGVVLLIRHLTADDSGQELPGRFPSGVLVEQLTWRDDGRLQTADGATFDHDVEVVLCLGSGLELLGPSSMTLEAIDPLEVALFEPVVAEPGRFGWIVREESAIRHVYGRIPRGVTNRLRLVDPTHCVAATAEVTLVFEPYGCV